MLSKLFVRALTSRVLVLRPSRDRTFHIMNWPRLAIIQPVAATSHLFTHTRRPMHFSACVGCVHARVSAQHFCASASSAAGKRSYGMLDAVSFQQVSLQAKHQKCPKNFKQLYKKTVGKLYYTSRKKQPKLSYQSSLFLFLLQVPMTLHIIFNSVSILIQTIQRKRRVVYRHSCNTLYVQYIRCIYMLHIH